MAESLSPTVSNYLEAQQTSVSFVYPVTQKENDFAMLYASRFEAVAALARAALITHEEEALAHTDAKVHSRLLLFATRLLNNPGVQERIRHYTPYHQASLAITVDRALQELASIAHSDPADLFHPTGAPITNPHDMPRYARAAIKEFKIDKDGVVHTKFHDKLKALQMEGDYLGMFNEANQSKAPQVTVNLQNNTNVSAVPPSPVSDSCSSLPSTATYDPLI